MNLADFLCYADIHQLNRIAKSCGCECDSHSKHELIQAILSTILRRDWLDKLVQSMPVTDLRFIQSMLFEKKAGYSVEELNARALRAGQGVPEEERSDSRELIAAFRHRGWLFNGHSRKNQYLLQVPEDLKTALMAAIGRRFSRELLPSGEPEAYRDEHTLLAEDIHAFLRFVRDNEVPLTADGVIYKRMLVQLLDSLAVKEAPLPRVGFRFGYGRKFRHYPDRFSLLYDYCGVHGLIAEDDGVLRLTEKGQQRTEAGKREELWQMVQVWLKLYKGAIPNVAALAYWSLSLGNDWVTLQSLADCLVPLVNPFYYDRPEAVLELRVIRMLMHLGLLQLGEHENLGTVVRARAESAQILQRLAGIAQASQRPKAKNRLQLQV